MVKLGPLSLDDCCTCGHPLASHTAIAAGRMACCALSCRCVCFELGMMTPTYACRHCKTAFYGDAGIMVAACLIPCPNMECWKFASEATSAPAISTSMDLGKTWDRPPYVPQAELVRKEAAPPRAELVVSAAPSVRVSAGTWVSDTVGRTYATTADAEHKPKRFLLRLWWWLRRPLWGTRFLVTPVVPPDRVPARYVGDHLGEE